MERSQRAVRDSPFSPHTVSSTNQVKSYIKEISYPTSQPIYKPGSCYDYSLTANSWKDTGARLTSFRRGATITKLGRFDLFSYRMIRYIVDINSRGRCLYSIPRYLMATGGLRQKRALNTVEVFDPKRPKVYCIKIFEVACMQYA